MLRTLSLCLYLNAGECFVWSLVCSSDMSSSEEVVLECKYRSSLKPLQSHLRTIMRSIGSTGGVCNSSSGSSESSGISSSSNAAKIDSSGVSATIQKVFFDIEGVVNVFASCGQHDPQKKQYWYSCTSQTWQES